MTRVERELDSSGDAERRATLRRLRDLYGHLERLRKRRLVVDERLRRLHGVLPPTGGVVESGTADWSVLEAQAAQQFQRALHLRGELAETARAIARVEDEVADVLEWLAETSPERADERRALARLARDNAVTERARAAEFAPAPDTPIG